MRVLVFGGDARQIYCAGRLSLEPGLAVTASALGSDLTTAEPCDVLVLPYVSASGEYLNAPLCRRKIPLSEALNAVKKGTSVFCGMLPNSVKDEFKKRGAVVYDWFDDSELTVHNAGLTAEGAAQIIVKNSANGVGGSKILIIGWGRVAKACAALFKAMGAKVAVSARKESALAQIRDCGFEPAGFIDPEALESADVVVNTVPATVLFKDQLCRIKNGGWILELASKPYGVDFDAAESLGITVNVASGIPGKYTPESAGRLMAQSVINNIKKGGDTSG